MIGRSHLSKFTYVVVFSLIVSLTFTPLMFPVAPPFSPPVAEKFERELQSVRYKRIEQERKQKRPTERAEKLEKYHARHASARKHVELRAPYWVIGGGFESTLVLNNTFPRSIDVTPVVYTHTGRQVSAQRITLGKLASETISLRDLIGLEGYGQIALRFQGEPLEVHASLVIANSAQSIAVSHPFEKRTDYASSRLDGVFYVPSSSAQGRIAVSNTSDQTVEVAMALREEGAGEHLSGPSRPVVLAAHETQVVDIRPFLNTGPSTGQAAAATVTHSGAPGDVLVHGMVMDAAGFSANIRFLEPSSITELDLTSPIYQRSTLRPLVLLSNTGNQDANVELKAFYTMEGQSQETVLFNKAVARRNTAHVDLSPQMHRIPANARNVGLKIVDSGKHAGILADVLLVGASGSQVLQLFPKGFAGEVHPSHGFPFRIDTGMNTIITVANPSQTEELDYSLHLYFGDGKTYTHNDTTLKAGEIKHIDVRALRNDQTPGQRKALIPMTVTSGQGKVYFRPKHGSSQSASPAAASHEGHGSGHHGGARVGGVAGATIIDETREMSFATICQPVCPEEGGNIDIYVSDVDFGSLPGAVGDSYYVDLYWQFYDGSYFYANSVNWTDYDSGVVNASGNYIQFVGPGFTSLEFEADFGTYFWGCIPCTYSGSQSCYWTEGTYIPITVTGWIDVYSYGYFVAITGVDIEGPDPDQDSISIYVDGPPWVAPTIRATAERDGGADVILMEDNVAYGPSGIPFLVGGQPPPAGDYFRVTVNVVGVNPAPQPAAVNINRAECGDARTRVMREYVTRNVRNGNSNEHPFRPGCPDFVQSPQTTSHFNWNDYNHNGYHDFAIVRSYLQTSIETIRTTWGHAMNTTAGYRCPDLQDAQQGDFRPGGRHMHGDAMDTDTPNHPDDDDYDDIKVIAKNNGACVEPRDIAPGWIHIDFRVGNGWTSCPTGW